MKNLWLQLMALVLILGVIFGVGGSVYAGTSEADSAPDSHPPEEVLYYVDTGTTGDGESALFRVNLDPATGWANLILMPNGMLPYNHVDVLAATPTGDRIYFIDDGPPQFNPTTATLGYYEVASATVVEVGLMTLGGENFVRADQAAFSRAGVLYITNTDTDKLYSVDPATAVASEIGDIVNRATNAVIDIRGGDIAYGAFNAFYLWVNVAVPGAPRGLYSLDVPDSPGVVNADLIGEASDPHFANGLATRANGYGDLAASTYEDEVHVVSKATGQDVVTPFAMHWDGAPFDANQGDMSNGPLKLCTRTIGYWKNHSWEGRSITIRGVLVGETEGQEVLRMARMNNFSMLFAQLIAAKLNTNNATGVPVIDHAEAWLLDQDVINPDGSIDWFKRFDSPQQKQQANHHKDGLDKFNNSDHCYITPPPPCWVEDMQISWCELAAEQSEQVLFVPLATR